MKVTDSVAPVLTLPSDLSAATTGTSATVNFTASALDAIAGTVAVTCSPVSGSPFPVGTTEVSCSATDPSGNESRGSFQVLVSLVAFDTEAPVFDGPGDLVVEAQGRSGATVNFAISASDAVDGIRPVTCTPASGSVFPIGTTTVACSASDLSANVSSYGFRITVADTTAPILSGPASMAVISPSVDGVPVTFSVTAFDLVDGTLLPVCTPSAGSSFPVGRTRVNCSAVDAASNIGRWAFDVVVTGPVVPITPDPVIPNPVTPDPVTPDPVTPDPVTPTPPVSPTPPVPPISPPRPPVTPPVPVVTIPVPVEPPGTTPPGPVPPFFPAPEIETRVLGIQVFPDGTILPADRKIPERAPLTLNSKEIIVWETAAGAKITETTSVPRGSGLVLKMSGFDPFSQVRLELHSNPVYLMTVRADGAGIVEARITLPMEADLGKHHVVAIGLDPDGQERVAKLPISIVEPVAGWNPLPYTIPLFVVGFFLMAIRRRRADEEEAELVTVD